MLGDASQCNFTENLSNWCRPTINILINNILIRSFFDIFALRIFFSRFDLVYIMLDRPNEVMDSKLSRHVLSLHSHRHDQQLPSSSKQVDAKVNRTAIKICQICIIHNLYIFTLFYVKNRFKTIVYDKFNFQWEFVVKYHWHCMNVIDV